MDQTLRMPRPVDIGRLLVTIQAAFAAVGAVFMGAVTAGGGGAPPVAWALVALMLAAGVSGWLLADRVATRRRRVLVLLAAWEAALFAAGVVTALDESDFDLFSLISPNLVGPVVVAGLLLVPSSARAWFDR
ncbi:hypothetical protein [Nonomuraea roseola]|uniref:Histidine kinase n=1 Tax=Nonomuraea roseola TaxID=46179 RepID=A0ABV5QE68_9ACTN